MGRKLKTHTCTPSGAWTGVAAEYVPADVAQGLLDALVQADNQMRSAGDAIEAGLYNEALLYVRSLPRKRLEAIAAATEEE